MYFKTETRRGILQFEKDLTLLLALLNDPQKKGSDPKVRALLNTVDWARLVQLTINHQMVPLLFEILRTNYVSFIPPDIYEAFEFYIENNRVNNEKLLAALTSIAMVMENNKIDLIPFKGPMLGKVLYDDPQMRVSRDLDLLVNEADLHRVMECLFKLDYRLPDGTTPSAYKAIRRYGGQYILFHQKSEVAVEPHWELTPTTVSYKLDYKALWKRSEIISFNGISVRMPAPEDYFLMLCIHGAKEDWPSLKPIVDLAHYIQMHRQLNWDLVIKNARHQGVLRIVNVGLELTTRCQLVTLPSSLLKILKHDNTAQSLALEVLERIAKDKVIERNIYTLSWFQYRQRERYGDKIRYIWLTITTPRVIHYDFVAMPKSLYWFYPIIKVIHDYLALPIWLMWKNKVC